jgi:hypothetical protein
VSAPYNPHIDLQVARGHGLHLQINGQPVADSYGAIVMAELAQLCDFPDVRVEVQVRARVRPAPAEMAHAIATELGRNEIWD